MYIRFMNSVRFKNGLKLRPDMKDNRKCITISFSTSIGNQYLVGIEASSGSF